MILNHSNIRIVLDQKFSFFLKTPYQVKGCHVKWDEGSTTLQFEFNNDMNMHSNNQHLITVHLKPSIINFNLKKNQQLIKKCST